MSFYIVTDSSCDLLNQYYTDRDIRCLPLTYLMDGQEHPDIQTGESTKTFYDAMRGGAVATTSGVNDQAYTDVFEEIYKAAQKPILCLAFSSGLSVTCQSALTAKERFLQAHPEAEIYVIDSLAASMGEGLLLKYAADMRDEGKSAYDVAGWLESNKLRLCHEFTVDDLVYLKRGGRVSSAAAFFGTMMNIKPVLHVDDAGHLIPVKKVRGRKTALKELFLRMQKAAPDASSQTVFISNADCKEDAEYLADMIRSELHPKDVFIGNIGPVVGAHSGPGTVALFFLGTSRNV